MGSTSFSSLSGRVASTDATVIAAMSFCAPALTDANAIPTESSPPRFGIPPRRRRRRTTINVNGKLTQKPSVLTAQPRIAHSSVARGITQRVMFPENVAIDPGLTVAMNDDSLYGWIAPGQSKPLPPGTKLTFSTDRPSVVSVDKGDVIRTVSNGVATVTATAKYHGASASTSFVVRVLSVLTDLRVGRATVSGFRP